MTMHFITGIKVRYLKCCLEEISLGRLEYSVWVKVKTGEINPLSPDIHLQILQTDLHTFP